MGATAAVTILATVSGLPEGGIDQILYSMSNTSAAHTAIAVTVATAQAAATGVQIQSSAQMALFIPPATNTFPWRFSPSTAEAGFLMSSVGAGFLRMPGGGVAVCYTTAGTAFVMRIITY